MSRKRSVLHSQERHRSRKYKRRIRNLLIEILLIIIFVFVAIKFVKNEDETPTVSQLGSEEQKQIINQEMQESHQTDNKNEKELQIPEVEKDGIVITKAIINYTENQKQYIINVEVKNYGKETNANIIPINLVNDEGTVLEKTYVNVQELEPNGQIRLNIVCENNLSEATKIEIRDERVY